MAASIKNKHFRSYKISVLWAENQITKKKIRLQINNANTLESSTKSVDVLINILTFDLPFALISCRFNQHNYYHQELSDRKSFDIRL